jgi:cation diffusion facilitator CzcD-associated flavoprotein CzcO
MEMTDSSQNPTDVDAVIVGAGFAGLYMLHRLREQGLQARVYEIGDGVGGTWYWNRYPGARCDVESMEYSYQFSEALQQEWQWTERYSAQPEILAYANHVADRFALRSNIRFNTRVEKAHYQAETQRWSIAASNGDVLSARYCIMATGCLSSANTPEFEGLSSYEGATYHTGQWPKGGVDFSGQRVGVIGTGSSAIQSIPIIADQAEHLMVFQRTANFSVPAQNRPLDDAEQREIKAEYSAFRARNKTMGSGFGYRYASGEMESALAASADQREQRYQERWNLGGLLFMGAYSDLGLDKAANETAAEFVRNKIRQVVDDPDTAEKLCPDNVVGCKRLCADTGYFETYNRADVSLVDVGEQSIERFTPRGLEVAGQEHEFDSVIFATGFDAMTGALARIDIRGREGLALTDKWSAGPRTYLGLTTRDFPNLFMITGPGSPSVLTNMLPSIEQHVEWIADCISYLDSQDLQSIEPDLKAEDSWVGHVNEIAGATLLTTCNSWYLGANVPGKPRVFMPYLGFPNYVEKCQEVVANGYQGFEVA